MKHPVRIFDLQGKLKYSSDPKDNEGFKAKKPNKKKWRKDLGLWEEEKQFINTITYYIYSIFKDGKLRKHARLFKHRQMG